MKKVVVSFLVLSLLLVGALPAFAGKGPTVKDAPVADECPEVAPALEKPIVSPIDAVEPVPVAGGWEAPLWPCWYETRALGCWHWKPACPGNWEREHQKRECCYVGGATVSCGSWYYTYSTCCNG